MKHLWTILGGVASGVAIGAVVWSASAMNTNRIQTDKAQTQQIQEVKEIAIESAKMDQKQTVMIDSICSAMSKLGESIDELKTLEYATRSYLVDEIKKDNSLTTEEIIRKVEQLYGLKKNEIVLRSNASGID